MVSLLLFFVACVLMLAAVLSTLRARRLEQIAKVNQRLEELAFLSDGAAPRDTYNAGLRTFFSIWLRRVGIPLKPGTALLLLMVAVLSGFVVHRIWGALAASIWLTLLLTLSIFLPQIRYRQKVNKLISQIPLLIDQIIRGLVTGRNVEGAIKLATEDLKTPLREVIERAQKNVELGADLGDALRDAAHFHDLKELHMLALAIHTSRVYGGSPREMLESIVNLIRQREQMQRELRAMTGETRASAWVLGLLPTLMGGYMVWTNPSYIGGMWHDPTGQKVLLGALGLQAMGALVMWRLIKSV